MGLGKDGGGGARAKLFPPGWNEAAKSCHYCKSTAAQLYCEADSVFMCIACDASAHENISHERLWLCEQAPATVTCMADTAALGVACDDGDIHSANPLPRHHHRSPVVTFAESALESTATTGLLPTAAAETSEVMKPVEFLFSDTDQFLDFDYSMCAQADCIVPSATIKTQPTDFSPENMNSYNSSYTTASLGHSVLSSSSSLDAGIVPDISGNQTEYRKARVLRYKEKRKNRKFQKTIRYASRKAYAETRPRIKGRFAKRTQVNPEVDRLFSHGAVPSPFHE